jgi:hypothetical protein
MGCVYYEDSPMRFPCPGIITSRCPTCRIRSICNQPCDNDAGDRDLNQVGITLPLWRVLPSRPHRAGHSHEDPKLARIRSQLSVEQTCHVYKSSIFALTTQCTPYLRDHYLSLLYSICDYQYSGGCHLRIAIATIMMPCYSPLVTTLLTRL